MTLTRREMLTAASAVGLTTILTEKPAVASANSNCVGDAAACWVDVPHTAGGDHYPKAAELVSQSGCELFKYFTAEHLTDWKAKGGTRWVRGFYLNKNTQKNSDLLLMYSLREVTAGNRTELVLHVVGGEGLSAERGADELRNDVITTVFSQGQKTAAISIPNRLRYDPSLVGQMVRHVENGQAAEQAKYTIEYDSVKHGTSILTVKA